eukprot:m.151682 g.151682  ORF g.151682 m.151682 type:complete len:217 (+) comp20701_c0_seq12:171-821(+)
MIKRAAAKGHSLSFLCGGRLCGSCAAQERVHPEQARAARLMETKPGSHHMLAQDIRKPAELVQKLTEKGVDFSAPTICISECVLVYLPPEDTRGLLQALASAFTEMFYLNYEQINPHDSFGKMMLRNLRTRGCALLGLEACPDLAAQKQRFLAAGFGQADALDMNGVYLRLEEDDRKRIERIEMLDEMEEWQLICAHYCISWAAKGPAVEAMQCRV